MTLSFPIRLLSHPPRMPPPAPPRAKAVTARAPASSLMPRLWMTTGMRFRNEVKAIARKMISPSSPAREGLARLLRSGRSGIAPRGSGRGRRCRNQKASARPGNMATQLLESP